MGHAKAVEMSQGAPELEANRATLLLRHASVDKVKQVSTFTQLGDEDDALLDVIVTGQCTGHRHQDIENAEHIWMVLALLMEGYFPTSILVVH
jgi:hypothetical protein